MAPGVAKENMQPVKSAGKRAQVKFGWFSFFVIGCISSGLALIG